MIYLQRPWSYAVISTPVLVMRAKNEHQWGKWAVRENSSSSGLFQRRGGRVAHRYLVISVTPAHTHKEGVAA